MNAITYFKKNITINVILALCINTTAVILGGGASIPDWVRGCCCAFTINTVAAAILPMGRIAEWFTVGVCHAKPDTFKASLASNFIVNAIYVTIVSFSMACINVGINAATVPAWLSTYIQLHLVGLIVSLIIEKPMARLFPL